MSALSLPRTVQDRLISEPLELMEELKLQIAEVSSVDQAREMQAQAEGMKAFLESKLSRASEEARAAAELLLRVKRRIGELLPPPKSKAKAGASGGRGNKAVRGQDSFPRQRRAEFRALAKQPEEAFESYVEECREKGVPPSANGARGAARPAEPDPAPSAVSPVLPGEASKLEALAECLVAANNLKVQLLALEISEESRSVVEGIDLDSSIQKLVQAVLRASRRSHS